MEAVLMNATNNYKRDFLTNLYSYPSHDLLFATLLSMPPSSTTSHSYPPSLSLLRPPQQPPLLPLPISMPFNHTNINRNTTSNCNNNIRSSPRINNKNLKTRGRDHSLTPKKSKNHKKNSKREDEQDLVTEEKESSINEMIGPDPKDLPKDVISRVFSSSSNKSNGIDVDNFSGSVMFTPSPPPSSLPLPTFSLRPKLSCNVEAASGVDAGATASLRRLLRL